MKIPFWHVRPVSMVTCEEPPRQRIELTIHSDFSGHLRLLARHDAMPEETSADVAVLAGKTETHVMLPVPDRDGSGTFRLFTPDGKPIAECTIPWKKPREWTLWVMRSSHTDIGLHNSQYFQRYQSENFIDEAVKMAETAASRHPAQEYHYLMEGSWFWNNYGMDRGRKAAEKIRDEYIRTGRIGVCCGIAGNHTQVYGLEEMCRSAYNRRQLKDQWGIDSHTMSMIDNNGMSWALVHPYAEAGYRNIIFAPNHWNPLPSTIWRRDVTIPSYIWNTEAGGGGSRIDVRYESNLPMVFYWQGPDRKSRILVWASTQYDHGGIMFGLHSSRPASRDTLLEMETRVSRQLDTLESKYPYDLWLLACYCDDEVPNLRLSDTFAKWNSIWKYPRFRTVGNPDEPFEILREKFGDRIPVLSGDITGGWYQHPLSAPDCLADKFAADRALPTAEKLSVLAALADPDYRYPAEAFRRAWYALMLNDEHSYGTSGYQGRRVYETWLQHRDWIGKAARTAEEETKRALAAIGGKIRTEEKSLLIFNPSAFPRRELLSAPEGGVFLSPEIPAFGYKAVPLSGIRSVSAEWKPTEAPVIENRFYRIAFAPDGSFQSVFDKAFQRELFDVSAPFRGNQFVYTDDNHATFHTPAEARFEICTDPLQTIVRIHTEEPFSGAEIELAVTLPAQEKRIDTDLRLNHVRGLVNANRYFRYGYCAFPFAVEHAVRRAHLNGCVASPGEAGQTGHGTETYLAAREWSCAENGSFGAALFQLDSQLVEFDHIHPDKTDCFMNETGSAVYAYLFNDWLQMHTPGGSHVNLQFRFSITSYAGDFRKAGIPAMAERISNPLPSLVIPPHPGVWPDEQTFLALPENLRLLSVKRAEDSAGIAVRFQETLGSSCKISCPEFLGRKPLRVTVDERPMGTEETTCAAFGTATFLFPAFRIPEQKLPDPVPGPVPAAVGGWYTGLITEPCACCGASDGQLYLIWGQNMEKDLSHYDLFRGTASGFPADESTLLAHVEPGPYRVALYEETGLETHTRYYYRVRAVNQAGVPGPLSREFSGITREMLPDEKVL